MNPEQNNPQLTEADLDRALLADRDALVPSSGFSASVLSAIQASAPAPIPFPWKRAIPGFAAAALALVLLAFTIAGAIRSLALAPAPSASLALSARAYLAPVLAHASDISWIALSLAIPFLCLLFCRRLLSPR